MEYNCAERHQLIERLQLLQLAKSWGNFISDRIIIWRLPII